MNPPIVQLRDRALLKWLRSNPIGDPARSQTPVQVLIAGFHVARWPIVADSPVN